MTQPTLEVWLTRGQKEPKVKRPIPRRTKKRAREDRQYNARVKVWLETHKWCEVWLAQRGLTPADVDEIGMAGWEDDGVRVAARCPRATQCHHKNGRTGFRLLDESNWCAVSDLGHRWLHANPSEARRIGVLV